MGRPFNIHPITDDSALGGSSIERSLRFNDGDNTRLTRTIGSTSNRRTFTYSWWLKRTMASSEQYVWYVGSSPRTRYLDARFEANSHELQIQDYLGGSNRPIRFITNRQFRDASSWYHFVFAVDTTQGTASNRAKLYVNGVQETSFSTETYPDQNYDSSANVSGHIQVWGTNKASTSNDLDGYLAEAHLVDGQQLTPSSFGYIDDATGIWRPKKYEGTHGTNGFYLDFSDNSAATATTIGKDRSGNDNNFTPSNFSVSSGPGNDSLPDTPSNNFCTMNPLVPTPSTTWANGNLDLSGGTSDTYSQTNLTTFGVSSGKWYAEVKITYSTTNVYVGVCPSKTPANLNLTGSVTDSAVLRMSNTTFIEGTETGSIFDSISSGDTIGIALDMDNLRVWFSKNGTYANSGNPATGTNAIFSGITAGETMSIAARPLNGTLNFNFGQRPFSYTPPTGYKAWSTNNLLNHSLPSIIKPQQHFECLTWTGNGSASRDITGLEFKPDLVWIKRRANSQAHSWQDSVIGFGDDKTLRTENNNALDTNGNLYGYINYTLKDGININGGTQASGNDSRTNAASSNNTYVAWCWRAGGSSNTFNIDGTGYASASAAGITDGNLPLTAASINRKSGFSIVRYTGNGGSSQTLAHGLGIKPKIFMTKCITDGSTNWDFHAFETVRMDLNNTVVNQNNSLTSFTNDYLTIASGSDNRNGNAKGYVAYIWAEIPGYSKLGTFTGNGNSDGTFVYTGFRPSWVMTKTISGNTSNWNIYDHKRNPHNIANRTLYANLNNAESAESSSGNQMDLLSNGFKMRGSNVDTNGNGSVYIYMAFAKQPGNTPYQTEPVSR